MKSFLIFNWRQNKLLEMPQGIKKILNEQQIEELATLMHNEGWKFILTPIEEQS